MNLNPHYLSSTYHRTTALLTVFFIVCVSSWLHPEIPKSQYAEQLVLVLIALISSYYYQKDGL